MAPGTDRKKIHRVAVVGCGGISVCHIRGILAAGQTIAALCDVIPERAEEKKTEFGLTDAKVYRDFAKMLESEAPDAVHICTPHHLHAPMTVFALKKGIHVLCEKPLCISEEQLCDVLRAERESRATLGVCQQNRYEPVMRQVKELAKDGSEIVSAFGSVVWKRDEAYYRSGEWRGKKATEGGGVLINQALHTLDLLQWFCGMPESVSAHLSNDHLKDVIEVEDTASLLFTYPDGKTVHLFATTAAGANLPVQIHLKFRDGTVLTAENAWMTREGGGLVTARREAAPGKREWGTGHRELIAHFYDCVGTGEKFPIDGREAGKVVRLLLSAYASEGKTIRIIPEKEETI